MRNATIKDFRLPFSLMKDYKFGEPITRENFTCFIVISLLASRGDHKIQRIFFMWQEQFLKMPVLSILDDFAKQDGFDTLTSIEKDKLRDGYRKVVSLKHQFTPEYTDSSIRNELQTIRWRRKDNMEFDRVVLTLIDKYFNFRQLTSLEKFVEAAEKYFDSKDAT